MGNPLGADSTAGRVSPPLFRQRGGRTNVGFAVHRSSTGFMRFRAGINERSLRVECESAHLSGPRAIVCVDCSSRDAFPGAALAERRSSVAYLQFPATSFELLPRVGGRFSEIFVFPLHRLADVCTSTLAGIKGGPLEACLLSRVLQRRRVLYLLWKHRGKFVGRDGQNNCLKKMWNHE